MTQPQSPEALAKLLEEAPRSPALIEGREWLGKRSPNRPHADYIVSILCDEVEGIHRALLSARQDNERLRAEAETLTRRVGELEAGLSEIELSNASIKTVIRRTLLASGGAE